MEALHWKTEQDEQGIVWVTLDRQHSSVNTLSSDVMIEFKTLLQTVESLKPKGLVIQSGKKNGFVFGADVQEFESLDTEEKAFHLIRQGQEIFQQLETLCCPTIALIQGVCLGGGLELALACDYRVSEASSETKLGLPEVLLGIHPGWGGTLRLPRLIGVSKAMELILSGRLVSGSEAFRLGLVDALVPRRNFERAAREYLLNQPAPKKRLGFKSIDQWPIARSLLAKIIRRKLASKVNPLHYPAPYAALDHFVEYGVRGEAAYLSEARSVAQLMVTGTARNLLRVFHLKEKFKSFHRETVFKPQRIHIVGAGVMGGDIAAWIALKGFRVTLQDQNKQAIAQSLKRAAVLFTKLLKEPHLIQAAKDRLLPDEKGFGIAKADLIIEAVIEKREAKQALFESLNNQMKPEAILASNTSTIPLEELVQGLKHPDRLVGIHFFNPVSRMPLVEIITGKQSDVLVVAQAAAFMRALDKLPLLVKSAPGFLVNRLLMPYLQESMILLEEGISPQAIDQAAETFGMPMGPIELADTVGLDICLEAAEVLKTQMKGPLSARLRLLVEQGHLGKKTGSGFYAYKNGKAIKEKLAAPYRVPEDVVDRLMLRMINEAMTCLREKIVSDADYLDAGMIFGAGFPPFRGGPLHYVKEQGKVLVLQRLNLLAQRYGARFLADPEWKNL